MIGGNSARLHGYPFWFFDSYFADLKGPGTYFDIGSFLADVAVWSLIVLVVAAAVAVLRRSVGTNAAQRVLRSSTR